MKGKYKLKKKTKDTSPGGHSAAVDTGKEQTHAREEERQTEAGHNEKPMNKLSKWWHDPAHVIQSIGVAIGTIVALIYAGQLCQMIESNRFNREALQSVQRAFVIPGIVVPMVIGTERGAQSIRFQVHWDNSGTTPTRAMRGHVSMKWNQEPLPDDYSFPDLWSEGQPHIFNTVVLGPKAGTYVDAGAMPIQAFDHVVKGESHLNFWGWATYRDIFDGTPMHITKFCVEFIPHDVDIGTDTTKWKYSTQPCQHNNCYDDECKAPTK